MTVARRLQSDSFYVPISATQYRSMIASGIIEDGSPVELLEGLMVPKDRSAVGEDPLGHNPLHRAVITLLQALSGRIETTDRYLQVQLPFVLSDDSEPEPDAAVIRGNRLDHIDRLPVASEVLCVVEAADSSLRRDAGQKKRIYAEAGISQYVLINLQNGSIEVFTAPHNGDYTHTVSVRGQQSFTILDATDHPVAVRVSDLLPKI